MMGHIRKLFPPVAGLVVAMAAIPAQADPLSDLLSAHRGSTCFERVYSPEHLKKHPKQAVTALLVSLESDADDKDRPTTFRMRFDFDGQLRYSAGECRWDKVANRTVQGERILDAYRQEAGVQCNALVSADASSAEEGSFSLLRIDSGDKIMLYLDDGITVWPSFDRSKEAEFEDIGPDDRIFQLSRIEASACAAMNKAMPSWWRLTQ